MIGIRSVAATTDVFSSGVVGDAFDRHTVDADGKHEWGSGAAAPDTNLYRSSANNLRTDDQLSSSSDLVARFGAAGQVVIGSRGPGAEAGLDFGSAGDTVLYRSAADTLRTADSFVVQGNFTVQSTTTFDSLINLSRTSAALKFNNAGQEQTTVGLAGGASALPLTPTKYFKVLDSAGTTLVIPAYAA